MRHCGIVTKWPCVTETMRLWPWDCDHVTMRHRDHEILRPWDHETMRPCDTMTMRHKDHMTIRPRDTESWDYEILWSRNIEIRRSQSMRHCVVETEVQRLWDTKTTWPWDHETHRLYITETMRPSDYDHEPTWHTDTQTHRPWDYKTVRLWDTETMRP